MLFGGELVSENILLQFTPWKTIQNCNQTLEQKNTDLTNIIVSISLSVFFEESDYYTKLEDFETSENGGVTVVTGLKV